MTKKKKEEIERPGGTKFGRKLILYIFFFNNTKLQKVLLLQSTRPAVGV